jgi:hypothetical protein
MAYHHLKKYRKAVLGREFSQTNDDVLAFECGLALEPTNEELIQARGESKMQLGKQQRFEHLDSGYRPQVSSDYYQKVEILHCTDQLFS